jgi:hypothetical protein
MKFLLPLIVLLFPGCAAIEQADRSNTEKLLAAAGFKVLPANTTERQLSLEAARPYKVERKLKGEGASPIVAKNQFHRNSRVSFLSATSMASM